MAAASQNTITRSLSGTAVSMMALNSSGGMTATTDARITVKRKPMSCPR